MMMMLIRLLVTENMLMVDWYLLKRGIILLSIYDIVSSYFDTDWNKFC